MKLIDSLSGLLMSISTSITRDQSGSLNLIQKLEGDVTGFGELIRNTWYFNLFTVKGSTVQVNQVIIALFLLTIGLLASRWITHRVKNYLRKYSKLDESAILFLHRIVFYSLAITIILTTLQMIGLPITMFAFIGGAVIIGIGFGTQNIFNNFISGIILMIERPVRIGDLIEIDTHLGRVDVVGARCTRIRRLDGVELLVPNSKLLESNVINRTLTDKKFRASVAVGVAYGSPTRQVVEIMQSVVDKNSDILVDPKPHVFFSKFGSNSLDFETMFWIEVNTTTEIRRIRSNVMLAIDDAFREAGIVIAFPQRDVHLGTLRPLNVNLIRTNEDTDQDEQSISNLNKDK
ncbi:MAG: mechanosensitive ion channel [Candidatus Electryonea clarkiae]|nr:mechanosensitive ion channel [Candidatus Electryonea clarkiae]MDP8286641.1 mechanosensitive ion channel [Candidatus Electryonea clarkiae]